MLLLTNGLRGCVKSRGHWERFRHKIVTEDIKSKLVEIINKIGKFEAADGSTIFLDEIGETSEKFQAKLLRVLQSGELQKVGSSETQKVDVRVIAATNKNLEKLVAEKQFREDLYYRLNVITINLPNLNDRKEDIPYLADYFASNENEIIKISASAMETLKGHYKEVCEKGKNNLVLAMNDKELYKQILGIVSPWEVSEVELSLPSSEVKVRIVYNSRKGICPECGQEFTVHDYREERSWRHLDTCQMTTTLTSKLPRINCPSHGVKTVNTPWSEPNSRTTMLFERFSIDLLLASKNQTKTAKMLRVSFSVLHHIMEKAVERGLLNREESNMEYIGIDEKSMKKGHNYITVLSDTKERCVIEVGETRTATASKTLLNKGLSEKQKKQIKGVSMDMWKGFMNAVKEELPNASIVHKTN